MTITKFSEEFARLIVRYTDTFLWNNDPSNVKSLTEEEIILTIHHVLQILSIKGFEDKKNKNLLEVPNSTNAVIPKTSDVEIKSKPNDEIIHACRSGQSIFYGNGSTSDTSLKTFGLKKDQKNSFNTLQNETKQSFPQSIKLLKEEEKTKSMRSTPSKLLVENKNIFERRNRTGGIRTNKPVKKIGEFKVGLISNLILIFVLITVLLALVYYS